VSASIPTPQPPPRSDREGEQEKAYGSELAHVSNTPIRTIAVTGATGYVGRFVVAELGGQGAVIRALARPESNRAGFDTPVEWVEGNLLSDDTLSRLVDGADAVVHLAYEHVPGRYRGGEGDDLPGWIEANVNGSLRLLLAARDAAVGRFIFLSSRAVFSRTEPGRALDETHPISPDTHYGAYKAAVEAFLKSFAGVEGIKTCSVRATGVYGLTYPAERSKWWGLIRAVLKDEPVTSHGGGTEVYGGDVARTIWALLTRADIPDVVHLSDLYVTHREVVRLAREMTGRPGTLPDAPTNPPENVMTSRYLGGLGIQLGGQKRLEHTVQEIIQAVEISR
jgi:nucleoside-diphosphate-sugar epimerase